MPAVQAASVLAPFRDRSFFPHAIRGSRLRSLGNVLRQTYEIVSAALSTPPLGITVYFGVSYALFLEYEYKNLCGMWVEAASHVVGCTFTRWRLSPDGRCNVLVEMSWTDSSSER